MSTELDEIKRIVAESGDPEKYSDTIRQMEMMEQQTAKLEKANAEMRENLAKMQAERDYRDSMNALRADVEQIKVQTGDKPLTKEEILSIKDDAKRHQAITENMHLFQKTTERREEIALQTAQANSNWNALSRYGITKDNIQNMTKSEIIARVPSGYARVFALNQIMGK